MNSNKRGKMPAPKMMPNSLEAEQSILGCLMINNDVPLEVFPNLKEDDFYNESHRKIYEAMNVIYEKNMAVDFVTVVDELENQGILQEVGGIEYISFLTNSIPSTANFLHYVSIIKRDSVFKKHY